MCDADLAVGRVAVGRRGDDEVDLAAKALREQRGEFASVPLLDGCGECAVG